MADVDYKERAVNRVSVVGLNRVRDNDGTMKIGAAVHIGVKAHSGAFDGPTVHIDLTLHEEPGETIADLEERFLQAANALLTRLASEPVERLSAVNDEARSENYISKQIMGDNYPG